MYKLAFGPCVFTFSHVVQVAFFPNDTYFDLYARKCRRKGHRIKIFKGKKKGLWENLARFHRKFR